MTQHELLLRAIIDDPADDLARLAYADWLEENEAPKFPQYPSRAAFVRGSVEWEQSGYAGGHWFARLLSRGNALMNSPDPLPGIIRYVHPDPKPGNRMGGVNAIYRRGFVWDVQCGLADWLARGRAVCAAHPVERVGLTDRQANHFHAVWQWEKQVSSDEEIHPIAAHDLPPEIFNLLPASEGGRAWAATSEQLALDALSAALIAWARQPQADPAAV